MTANEIEKKLMKLAKAVQNGKRAPVNFSARVMTRVREQHALETSSAGEALWLISVHPSRRVRSLVSAARETPSTPPDRERRAS